MSLSSDQTAAPTPPTSRPRALVVDDHAVSITLMSLVLERFGFATVGAGSVEEARAHFAEEPFALIMVDALLGADNGIELARDFSACSKAAIVVTSGLDTPERLPAGIGGWLVKPYSPRSVYNVIRQAGTVGISIDTGTDVLAG